MKCLVCGLPGTGKTTYVKKHLGDKGLCYDLDAIAAALRLRGPHDESHYPARWLANDLFFAFCTHVLDYTKEVYIIRSAPQIEEMRRIMPDKVVICKQRYVKRSIANEKDLVHRLAAIEEYCNRYGIPIVSPEKSPDSIGGYVMPIWAQKR